jgi:hypothetical protein
MTPAFITYLKKLKARLYKKENEQQREQLNKFK